MISVYKNVSWANALRIEESPSVMKNTSKILHSAKQKKVVSISKYSAKKNAHNKYKA
jgi:hypothetical protein